MKKHVYILLLTVFALSCNTVEKMVEKGQYDEAFEYSVRHLAGKKNKKTKYVTALEEAYIRLNDRDLKEIEFLKRKNAPGNWDRVHVLYTKLAHRQNVIRPLLPLESKSGYIAHFAIKDYSDDILEVSNLSAAYHYSEAQSFLEEAQKGNKRAARRAMTALNSIDKYFNSYKDSRKLKDFAREIGTEHIAIEFATNNDFLGAETEDFIRGFNIDQLDTYWEDFHYYDGNNTFDNYVVIEINNLDLGRESEFVNHSDFSKEIEDGYDIKIKEKTKYKEVIEYEPVEDATKKGTTKKVIKKVPYTVKEEIKEKRYRTIYASITEIKREKRNALFGRVKIYNNHSDVAVYHNPINVNFDFYDEAVRLDGDRRALPSGVCTRLDNYISDFPSDYIVVNELSISFTSAVNNEIRSFDFLYD